MKFIHYILLNDNDDYDLVKFNWECPTHFDVVTALYHIYKQRDFR